MSRWSAASGRGRRVRGGVILLGALLLGACGPTVVTSGVGGGDAAAGEQLFNASCAECHGPEAVGTDQGPPLVDSIYRPSHHADGSFLLAVRRGSAQHHWRFGPMPPVQGLSDEDVAHIVAYVRGLQQEAGIE